MVQEKRTVPVRAAGDGSLEDLDVARLHAFTSHFYKKLTGQDQPVLKRKREEDPHAKAHKLVARWTKDFDIFDKTYAPASSFVQQK